MTAATDSADPILDRLPLFRETAERSAEIVLANLVALGEVPSPTFGEAARASVFVERLSEFGLQNCSTDEMSNAYGVLPGSSGDRNILLVANLDSFTEPEHPPPIEIRTDRIRGPFVGDNSLSLAAIASLPFLLDKLNLRLKANLVLMGASRALGRGNLAGIKFFLDHGSLPVQAGLCLESVQLGRINFSSLGMLRGEIVCRLPDDYNWAQFGASGTILPMSDIISRIAAIPLTRRPAGRIILGSLRGGISHQNIARQTTLGFEARSESAEVLGEIAEKIADIVEEVAARAGVKVELDIFARRSPGSLKISDPLVRRAKSLLSSLGIEPMLYPTTGALAAFLEKNIPALTLGISVGERKFDLAEIEELIDLQLVFTGLAQTIGMILAVDAFGSDENPA